MYKVPGEQKFHKQSVVALLKNGYSLRHVFYSVFAPLSVTKILEKHLRSSLFFKKLGTEGTQSYLKWIPFRSFYHTVIFISYFTPNIRTNIFQNSSLIGKSIKFMNENYNMVGDCENRNYFA